MGPPLRYIEIDCLRVHVTGWFETTITAAALRLLAGLDRLRVFKTTGVRLIECGYFVDAVTYERNYNSAEK